MTQEEKKTVHTPTIDELIELPFPNEARISPDGDMVAYTLTRPDWKANEFVTQIWLVAADGKSEPRQLTFAKTSSRSPRWSPDGRWLAFVSKRNGDEHAQVYRLSPYGGEAERLSEHETDVSFFEWSPDGRSIAYVAADPEDEARKQRLENFGEYRVEDDDHIRSHLWLLRLKDKSVLRLTRGDAFTVVGFDWNPRGGQIAFETWPSPDVGVSDRGTIYRLDLDTLGITLLGDEGCSSPRWSPDGSRLAFLHLGTPTYIANNTIRVVSFEGLPSEHEVETASETSVAPRTANMLEGVAFKEPAPPQYTVPMEFDEEMDLLDWGLDGLYCAAFQRTESHLFRVDARTGEVARITSADVPGLVTTNVTFNRDTTRAAAVVYDTTRYGEVALLDLSAGGIQHLTKHNDLIQDWQIGVNEVVRWKSSDGTEIEGVLTLPADFDPEKKYPLLVVIHGGPTGVSFPAKLISGYDRRLYPIQEWVAKGALVLQPNYRGSAGYGEKFRALNQRNLGLGDTADVVTGVDALVERGWVDRERVGVMGWSQGGYISAFCTTYASDRFKAASVGAGISNWVTYYANTDVHPFTRQYLGNNPWEDMQIYQDTSPMTYIRRAKTPTLIQHGTADQRVPLPNAYELYQGLRDMGVEARLVTYPGMPHGPTKPRICRQIMQENLRWFNRWIFEETKEEPSSPLCYVAIAGLETAAKEGDPQGKLPGEQQGKMQGGQPAYLREVFRHAHRDGADVCIFSADLGLVRTTGTEALDGAALTPETAPERARQVAEQVRAGGFRKLVVFTIAGRDDSLTMAALGCLYLAAGLVGEVKVEQRAVKPWKEDE